MVINKMSGRQERQGAGENPRSNKQTGRTQKANREITCTRGQQRQSGKEETKGRGLNTQVKDIGLINEGGKKKQRAEVSLEDEIIKIKQDVHTT